MLGIKTKIGNIEKYCDDLAKELKEYKGVRVGYMGQAKYPNSDWSLVKNALTHNDGLGVPKRPFLTIASKKNRFWKDVFKRNFERGLKKALLMSGARIEREILGVIFSGALLPNSPSTVAKKKSSRPLVDTGLLINSIQIELLKGEDK